MVKQANPLAFHAAPPAGHWINDPNALAHAGGAYRLFVQHRADAPAFRETGWARLSSPDLLRWTFDGAVIPPDGADWAYSGSVRAEGDDLIAVHTAHADGMERQVFRHSSDGGAHWSAAEPIPELGEPARNRRDPFVFREGESDCGGWALLLAEPCDWTDWREEPASRLRLYRSEDGRNWRAAGTIGPWHPPGVMWEVPVLARIDGRDVLFISTVDRRDGGAACAVRAWVGTLDVDGFRLDANMPADGQLVDFGPDFYALIPNVAEEWPTSGQRCFVAWAGSWATARTMRWPGFHGGPITLLRSLSLEARPSGPWLAHRPMTGVLDGFDGATDGVPVAGVAVTEVPQGSTEVRVTLAGPSQSLTIILDLTVGSATVDRRGGELANWSAVHRFPADMAGVRTLMLFVDGPLVELFLIEDGVAVTAALDGGGGSFAVEQRIDGQPVSLDWRVLGR